MVQECIIQSLMRDQEPVEIDSSASTKQRIRLESTTSAKQNREKEDRPFPTAATGGIWNAAITAENTKLYANGSIPSLRLFRKSDLQQKRRL